MFRQLKSNKKIHIVFIILLLIVFCFQQWQTFTKHIEKFQHPITYTSENFNNDYITKYGDRFRDIKNYLEKPTHLGYCSEPNQDIPTFYLHYVLSQYYLAPNLISKSSDNDTLLYNLYSSQQIDVASNQHFQNGWHELKNFNNGLIILSK